MTMRENHIDEWLERAFQLAFFLHGNRETAKTIAVRAMNKLETASNAQFKRYYYTPQGRAETARPARSRVSLNDLQLLQRLVFVESENFEREKEKGEKIGEKALVKFFIKHLVRISLKRNSFYVTLAVSRILHNYATSDAMEIYNIVVQDPERVHDDYYYRSRKGVLMKELKTRFGDLLEIVRVGRGEERFQAKLQTADNSLETALDALKIFTPWNSQCAIPDKFNPVDDVIKPFHFDRDDPDAEHRIEINRIHAALHPGCFTRLTDALQLPAPEEKMEIPKFMMTENQTDFDDNDWRNPPALDRDELQQIKDVLAAHAESRKAMTANLLRVVVDGAEQGRINLDETGAVNFDLDDGAELIEVRVVEKDGENVLATHLLSFEDLEKGLQTQSIMLEGGQKVSFKLAPEKDEFGEIVSLNCGVEYEETLWQKRFALALRRAKFALANFSNRKNWAFKPALTFGLILLAIGLGWIVFQRPGERRDEIVTPQTPANQNREVKVPNDSPGETNKEEKETFANNSPKNLRNTIPPINKRDEKTPAPKTQKPELADNPAAVAPKKENLVQTPKNELRARQEKLRKDEKTDENGVLRLPIRGENKIPKPQETRPAITNKIVGKSFNEIRQIYIDITGDQILGEKISREIRAELEKSGAFVVTTDKESADAALKIYIRHEADGDLPEDASVAAIVRLVNAEGFIVYPNRKRVSGWKYVGTMAKLPQRIASDLIEAKNKK